ncbi:MAG: hypothetical protein HYZ14_05695 [Bacteroidetes bacterium]|nr:hypothetical protein [Bacteroidota bacterium]
MKRLLSVATLFIAFVFSGKSLAQNSPALDYMNSISSKYRSIQEGMWEYTSTVAHGKSARKVESKRTALIQTTFQAMNEVKRMEGFEGDASYRDSVVSFLNIYYLILKEDYAKIVDMEEISERSYNDMEAYMNAKQAANEKMNMAGAMVGEQQRSFAAKHDITLVSATDDLSENMKAADKVYDYYNVLYLIFFKSYVQEKYLIEAINNKDVSAIEQNKNALLATSTEGLELLKKIESFNGDNTVVVACTEILTFYKDEAENKVALITDYFIKTENFNTIKASFDAIKPNNRTQQDVDGYNKAVNEMNASVGVYNSTNAELSASRTKYLDNWNNAGSKFTDKHVPKG